MASLRELQEEQARNLVRAIRTLIEVVIAEQQSPDPEDMSSWFAEKELAKILVETILN